MENTNSSSPPPPPLPAEDNKTLSEPSTEPPKKKKKTKVGLFYIFRGVFIIFFFVIGEISAWFSDEEKGSLATCRKVEKCTATL